MVADTVLSAECKPSKWGADDEIGSANTITPARVLHATKLVKLGKTHHLGIVIDEDLPAFPPRSLNVTYTSAQPDVG